MTPKAKNNFYVAGLALAIFTVTYTVLLIAGLVPKQLEGQENVFQVIPKDRDADPAPVVEEDPNLIPQRIDIPKIGISSTIEVPSSIDVATLDAALSRAAVYYPGSGTLQGGNVFLFGHSTNWKVVNNQAYKTFNDLQKLVIGDEIELTSNGKTYVYAVTSVRHAEDNDVLVEFNKGNRMLTISTCDSFGKKQDRWVVEAEFVRVS